MTILVPIFSAIFAIFLALRILYQREIGVADVFLLLFAYFFLGPAIARLYGYGIYVGIDLFFLNPAIFIFCLSFFSFVLGFYLKFNSDNKLANESFVSSVSNFSDITVESNFNSYVKVLLYPALTFTSIGILLVLSRGAWAATKGDAIATVGILHYALLTLVPALLISYMALVPFRKNGVFSFSVAFGLYALYSFFTGERDFVLFLVAIAFWVSGKTRIKNKIIIFSVIPLTVLFVWLALGRDGVLAEGGVASFLNQGSNLMVLTNVLKYLEDGGAHLFGLSYFSAILNILTMGIVRIWGPGSIWLSDYFSGGVGAYGFSLEAEAYLNFGLFGVFFVFFVLGKYLRRIESRAETGAQFFNLLYYHFAFFGIYSIRGEFLNFSKSMLYCVLFYFAAQQIRNFLDDGAGD